MIVPDQGLLHDVLLFVEQHQDRELACREAQWPEPVIQKNEPAATGDGDYRSKGDLSGIVGFHVHQ